jgi:hypothetical protein
MCSWASSASSAGEHRSITSIRSGARQATLIETVSYACDLTARMEADLTETA